MKRRALNGELQRLEEGPKNALQPDKSAVFNPWRAHFGPKMTGLKLFPKRTLNMPKTLLDHFRSQKRHI